METEKSLKVIEEMIASAKGNISDGSIFYLIWGWAVLLAALLHYLLLVNFNYENHWLPWPILMSLAGISSWIVSYRKNKKSTVKTYVERTMSYLWLSLVITLLIVLVGTAKIGYSGAYPVIIGLYGLGTFASGGILKFKPLKIGGIMAWICAIVAFFATFPEQLILIAVAIICSYIIPGHLLAKSNNV
jgi:hypothetical protein